MPLFDFLNREGQLLGAMALLTFTGLMVVALIVAIAS
jgi:hypothetical protein